MLFMWNMKTAELDNNDNFETIDIDTDINEESDDETNTIDDEDDEEEDDEDEEEDPRAKDMEGFKKVFINPIIEEESGEEWGFNEGCLSIPKIREEVFRKEKIVISYYNENWELKEETFDGYKARIIQHEYDHIEGILFTDKISSLKKQLIKKKLQKIYRKDLFIIARGLIF